MQLFKTKYFWVTASLVLAIGYIVSCTKDNQVLDVATQGQGTNILTSIKTASAPAFIEQSIPGPAWAGNIDAAWSAAAKLSFTAIVPNPGNNTFPGFIGNTTNVTLRSMYDNQYIYFLAEWEAPKVLQSEWWYFDPATNLWAQEQSDPVFDANGIMVRKPFSEDHFAMLWNINNSTVDFSSKTCYASCHVHTPNLVLDPVTGIINEVPVPGSSMRTNNINEKLDQWNIRMIQSLNFKQGNDEYQDWAGGVKNGDGMNTDAELPGATSGGANIQTLTITGTSTDVSVPKWVIPNKTNYNAILVSETINGIALKVIAVDGMGVLTLSNGTTIDPKIGTDYKQIGAGDGPKVIPGNIFGLYTGSFADITCNAFYTGTGWRIQFKRLLKTSDILAQDVDFSSLIDQPFGVGVFSNYASNQHAIKTNLLLKFQK